MLDLAVGREVDEAGDSPVNATLTIQVRVLGQQAMSQIGAIQKQVNSLNAAGAAGAAGALGGSGPQAMASNWQKAGQSIGKTWSGIRGAFSSGMEGFVRTKKSLEAAGQSLRRSGQQITFGFTLPFVLAVGAATKTALDNERAMISLTKVYGDSSFSRQRVVKETDQIAEALKSLSGIMGIAYADVIDIGGAWASTGLTGADLLNATRATTEAMVLGNLDAEQATRSLITIMAVWRTETDAVVGSVKNRFSELTDAVAILNSVENATGATMEDLVVAIEKAGGTAQNAGLSIAELSALISSMVPAAGQGGSVGNGIKTMISRIMAPTKQALEMFQMIGIETNSREWLDANVRGKIQMLGDSFVKLDKNTKNAVTSLAVGRWQLNRFEVMMSDIASGNGFWAKALDESSSAIERQGTYLKELNIALDSNPKKLDTLTNVIKNDFSDTLTQLLPLIIGFLNLIRKAAEVFNNLSPSVKSVIFLMMALVAAFGPVLMLTGVFVTTTKFLTEAMNLTKGVAKALSFTLGHLSDVFAGLGYVVRALLEPIMLLGQRAFILLANAAQRVAIMLLAAGEKALLFARDMAVAVLSSVRTAIAWLAQLALSFLQSAGAAVVSATTVAISWISTAASGIAASVSNMILSLSMVIASFAATAAAAIASALAVAGAWLVTAAGAVASAAAAIAAALATLGIPLWAVLAIAAAVVLGIVALFSVDFRSAIQGAARWVGDAVMDIAHWFGKLPEVMGRVMRAIWDTIAGWMGSIVDLLSYLNPFQRHSPSLVDNVKAGVKVITDEYAKLRKISSHVLGAVKSVEAFNSAIAQTQALLDAQEAAKQRSIIAEAAPQALPAFDGMTAARSVLEQDLIPLSQEIAKQSLLVAKLTAKYDALDAELEKAQRRLDDLQVKLGKVNDQISKSEDAISKYADTGITGMRALEDEIFANELAQKKLKLAIMDLEDAGGTFEDMQGRMQALNAEMEILTGERQGLYLGGAGSDILQVYEDQIQIIRDQQSELENTVGQIEDMNSALADLAREAERMDLEQWITFEPQLRQIDQLANGLEELPLAEILAGIEKENEALARLRPEQEKLNAQVEAQQGLVDGITARHTTLKRQLDDEQARLDDLNSAYDDIKALIADMTSNMNDFTSAAEQAKSEANALKDTMDGIAAGDYAVDVGLGDFASDGKSPEALMDEWAKELEDRLGEMPNPFSELQGWWEDVKTWFHRNFGTDEGRGNIGTEVAEWFKRNFSTEGMSNWMGTAGGWLESLIPGLSELSGWLERNFSVEGLSNMWSSFASWDPWDMFSGVDWSSIGDNAYNLGWDLVDGATQGIEDASKAVWHFLEDLAYNWIIDPIKRALGIASPSKVMAGIGNDIVMGLVNGISAAFGWLWGVVTTITGFLWTSFTTLVGWLEPIWGPVKDAAVVAWNAIGKAVSWVWNTILKPIWDAIWNFIVRTLLPMWENFKRKVEAVWKAVGRAISFAWNSVIWPALSGLYNFVKNTLIGVWDKLSEKVSSAWRGITSTVKRGAENMATFIAKAVNKAGSAFDTLANGVKWVGDKLGISIDLPSFPTVPEPVTFARGGIPPTDPNGGLYAGVRAIVGEGSNVWPEYVIPTDPRFRDRAKVLTQAAAERVGLFAQGGTVGQGKEDSGFWGGIVGKASDVVNGGLDAVKSLMRESASLVWAPFREMIVGAADTLPTDFYRAFLLKPVKMVEEWIKNSNPEISGDPDTLAGWKGKSGSFVALTKYLQSTGVPARIISGIRPGATTRSSGNTRASLHSMARAIDIAPPGGGVDNDGLLAIYRAFLPVRNLLTELIYSGPGGSNPSNPITRADHHNHVHVGLARGGRVPVHPFANGGSFVPHGNGIIAQIGEGMYDEKVQIIPLRDSEKKGGGDTIIEINGDLSFPNISNGDDAKKLIDNLKALAS